MASIAGPDPLFGLRNNFYIGAYQAAINNSDQLPNLSSDDSIERDTLVYRSYIALGSYQLVINEIDDSAATPLQAVKLLALYLARSDNKMPVEVVKEKLWKKCGTSVNSMSLELYDDTGAKISNLSDNARPLGFYSPLDGYCLHVIDLDPSSVTSGGWLEDTSLVEKYTISDEAYGKLGGTFRKFKETFPLKQQLPGQESKISDNYMEDLCANIKIGDRCEVEPGARRGLVKFVGQAETLAPGFWVGVQFDEPVGKHDGMVKGNRYFDCPPLHGAIVRPDKVKVGNYPEKDPFEEEEI